MEEDMIKVEELEYFNPFDSIIHKYNFLYSPVYPCNLDYLRQLFLAMACYDDEEKPSLQTYSAVSSDKPQKKLSPKYLQILKRVVDNSNNAGIKITRHKQCTKEDIRRLNKNIKQLKTNIVKYIKIIKQYRYNVILYDYLDNINEQLENADKYRNKVLYIYYLQELMQSFKVFNDASDKNHRIFDDWNKIFKLQNNTEILNFQGCLGLLLMNEFYKYYSKRRFNYSTLCAMLMTDLCIYSPLHKEIERKKLKILKKQAIIIANYTNDRRRGGEERDCKYYKQFREHFKEKQREAFLKNPKLVASRFATNFYHNPTMKIPYAPDNQEHKLIKLAEENNKEFKKTLASYGA